MAKQKRTPATINRWHVPNWRDASNYPETGADLSDEEWRWEFLRRLPEYREGWEDLAPRLKRPKGDPWRVLPAACTFGERFGLLYGLPDPRKKFAQAQPVFASSYRLAQTQSVFNYPFDLSRNLSTQVAEASRWLLKFQRVSSYAPPERKHPDRWPLLLRVIDARDKTPYHATFQQVGETLSPIAGRIIRGGSPRQKNLFGTEAAAHANEWHDSATDLMNRLVTGRR